jgi:hypothetical protein
MDMRRLVGQNVRRIRQRPELERALASCKKLKAKLVIAKLDRLSRNLAFIATLMDSGVEFVAVDNPHANRLTIRTSLICLTRAKASVYSSDVNSHNDSMCRFGMTRVCPLETGEPSRNAKDSLVSAKIERST